MEDVFYAHKHTTKNREKLKGDSVCGCFHCIHLFDPSEIREWTDNGKTALCPYCGIDAILGESSGYPMTEVFLTKMRNFWFE